MARLSSDCSFSPICMVPDIILFPVKAGTGDRTTQRSICSVQDGQQRSPGIGLNRLNHGQSNNKKTKNISKICW